MRTSVFAFADDLADEGADAVLERIRDRAGANDLTLAAAYHEARDLIPHGGPHRLRRIPGGEVSFRPDPARWRGLRLQPRPSALAAAGDPLGEACAAAAARATEVNAWVVFLHADRLGAEHPDCAPRTVFGDPLTAQLCPAHPDVRAYAVALAADVARHPVRSVRAESLHHHGFAHGEHHERAFVDLGALAELLLGLCFCASCVGAAEAAGVDVAEVRRAVRAVVEPRLADPGPAPPRPDPSRAEVASLAAGELGRFLTVREQVVTSLVADVAAAVRAQGSRLVVMDAPWPSGLDAGALDADGIQALGYAREPGRVASDLAALRARLRPGTDLVLALRPMHPDCDGPDNLTAKLAAARAAGVSEVDFYHYGLAPLAALDWVHAAAHGAGTGAGRTASF